MRVLFMSACMQRMLGGRTSASHDAMHIPAAHPLRVGRRVRVGHQGVLAGQRALEQQEPGAPGLTLVSTRSCGTRPGWRASSFTSYAQQSSSHIKSSRKLQGIAAGWLQGQGAESCHALHSSSS
jgi:hypothetical protein